MPVSPLPVVLPLLLVGIPLLLAWKGRRPFLIAAGVSASLLLVIFLSVFVPSWILRIRADSDPAAMYELARWTENHDAKLGQLILWPVSPDVLGGYRCLEQAADKGYPPAVYAVGVRLKYGQFVPRPPNWTGPGGNVFEQPEAGQKMIDKALQLGYKPRIDEEFFYWQEYRR